MAAFSDDAGASMEDKSNGVEKPPNFPWRHSAVEHQRVIDKDDLSLSPTNTARGRFARCAFAARELDVGWFDIFLTGTWKYDLASDMKWAFQKGVAGLLSHTFHVALQDIDKDEDGITFEHNGKLNKNWSEEQGEEAEKFLEGILEENLRNLYKNIDPLSIELVFRMKPIDFRFENAFVVPMLSRDLVKKEPSLKGAYSAILRQEILTPDDFSNARQMAEKLAKDTKFNGLRTIIADVSINCLETFQVRDTSSGELVAGSEEAVEVTHLVRFEVTRFRKEKDPEKQLGSWTIIDWDDLLEGNIWH